jgi:prepilin-type N-terminal cleavage/methylation domain-containing protein/prepilin-type processing-associated H-X9-DG protein
VEASSRGFTLIELLVVIAIVGVLAALALAAAGRFADSGKQATTAGRLRQVHMLQMAFAQDNNGRLTPFWTEQDKISWQTRLFPYLSILGTTRTDPKLVLNSPYQKKTTANQASFGMNSYIMLPTWDFRINRVPEPSKIILAGDMEQADLDYMVTSDGFDGWGNSPSWAKRPAYRHAGKKKAMMLFMDGHTELLDAAELMRNPTNGSPSRWRWW